MGESATGQLVLRPELGFNNEIRLSAEVSGIEPDLNSRNNQASVTLPLALADDQPVSLLWSAQMSTGCNPYSCSPVVADSMYLVSSPYVASLDKATSEVLWRYKTGGEVYGLVLDGESVYAGSRDNHLYSLNASTGTVNWQYSTSVGDGFSLVVADSMIYFGSEDGYFNALDASTGELIERIKTGRVLWPSVVLRGVVYASGRGSLTALDAVTLESLWEYDVGGGLVGTPFVAGSTVYVQGWGRANTHVHAVDATSGKLVWRYEVGSTSAGVEPFAADEILYTASRHGLYALDAFNGELLWQYGTGSSSFRITPTGAADGLIYAGSSDGFIHVLDTSNGNLRWRFRAGIITSIVVTDGLLYGSTEDRLFALRISP